MKKIDESVLRILSKATIEDNKIYLTCGQLDRKQYKLVNEILENMGGKWNKKEKAHIFNEDPTDSLEQILLSGEITLPKKYGYFPTPKNIVIELIKIAEIVPKMNVLEPSAGQGGIADFIPKECNLDCIELLSENVNILKNKEYNVLQADFLTIDPIPVYDRIIMNPPFEKQVDIDHVNHAWKFLSKGGRLISIMSSSVTFRENKKTVEFREFIKNNFGYIKKLPEGSFKESGTNVNSCFIVVDKE